MKILKKNSLIMATVEDSLKMATVEAPGFILPKKRNGKKGSAVFGHVDHIISVQGATESVKENPIFPSEHIANGVVHSTIEEVQFDVIINSTPHNADLSPIYEDSDGSGHEDLQDVGLSVVLPSYCNDSSSATPNTKSHTQSENSFEISSLTDVSKNSLRKKKKVNIVTETYETDNGATEITALRTDSKDPVSDEQTDISREGLTITGTIKRGKKKGQNVDVKLNISREELEMMERSIMVEEYNKLDLGRCSLYSGLHVLMLSVVSFPIVMCASSVYSFMMGTKTWYNILNHVIEKSDCFKKVLLAPLLILLYPFLITGCSLGLGLYAATAQLSLSGQNWWKEVQDLEKGFYSWLCDRVHLSQCSPYEVIILTDIKS